LRVLARCAHLRDVPALRRAGATVIAAAEAEVALALGEVLDADASESETAARREAARQRLYGEDVPYA
jgi:CPA2 family monovalent cation:H+ antiporter-2